MLINIVFPASAVLSVTLQAAQQIALYFVAIPLFILSALAAVIVVFYLVKPDQFKRMITSFKNFFKGKKLPWFNNDPQFEKALEDTGFAYDQQQDIFYSTMDAWQKDYGYCQLYDDACAPMSMIVDCEPIRFEYAGKRWLIQFWKGQYGMTTGCEVGVYNTDEPDVDIQGLFKGPVYSCASYADQLHISFVLYKKGKPIFSREDRHWWLTGYKLGEFSEPYDLSADISITLKDNSMLSAFVEAMEALGYGGDEFTVDDLTVHVFYKKPHSPQPVTRTPPTDWISQRKNELLCNAYNRLVKPYINMNDKLKTVYKFAPGMYENILDFRKNKELFEVYKAVTNNRK